MLGYTLFVEESILCYTPRAHVLQKLQESNLLQKFDLVVDDIFLYSAGLHTFCGKRYALLHTKGHMYYKSSRSPTVLQKLDLVANDIFL